MKLDTGSILKKMLVVSGFFGFFFLATDNKDALGCHVKAGRRIGKQSAIV